MRERRRLRRIMKRIPARFQSGGQKGQGYIKNISRGGLFLRAETLPEPGAGVTVLFLDRDQRKIEVQGTVRWTTDQFPDLEAQSGFGILFDEPARQNETFLEFYESLLLK